MNFRINSDKHPNKPSEELSNKAASQKCRQRQLFEGGCMNTDLSKFIRNEALLDKVVTAEEAATWIEDGMTLGMSGFTLFGEPKLFPQA